MACGDVVQDALARSECQTAFVDSANKLALITVGGVVLFEVGVREELWCEAGRRDARSKGSGAKLCKVKDKEIFSKVRVVEHFEWAFLEIFY